MPIPEPEKEEGRYSGRILLRVPIYLHKELSELARKEDISLNQLLNHLIERGLASLKYEDNSISLTKQTNQSLIAKVYEPVSPYKSKKMAIKKK